MTQDLICSVRELGALRQLHANAAQAQREFQIAFTQSCFMRDLPVAAFLGFTEAGMSVDVPEVSPTAPEMGTVADVNEEGG